MKKIVFFIALLASQLVNAQIAVTYVTADQAVQALLGPGVTYANPVFTGVAQQLGQMTGNTDPNFQITEGIVIGCSDAQEVVPNFAGAFITPNISGDPDLLSVANSVPPLIGQTFTVGSVNYIFGSDEYLTYVNSQYNDVFAFFLSGPGITGPYVSPAAFPGGAVNIAIVPQSTPPLPITISSVNNVLNAPYYIDNAAGAIPINLNGFTVKIAAQADLECGQTYHIRLAVANGTDTALKSDVIIEAGSFSTGASLIESVAVTNPGVSPIPGFPAGSILEGDGCYNGQFVITPPPCLLDTDTIQLLFSGTATINQDYNTNGVTEIILVPGISDTLFVNGMIDNLVEGTQTVTFGNITAGYETIEIGFVFFNPTLQAMDTATAVLNIVDYVPTELAPVTDILDLCPSAVVPVNATPLISNGVPNYTFNWQDSSGVSIGTNPTQVFSAGSAGSYELTVTDYCGNADSSIFVITEPPVIGFGTAQDLCAGIESELLVFGGLQPYSYQFDPLAMLLNPLTNTITGIADNVSDVIITDACNQTGTVPFIITVCDTYEPNLLLVNTDDYDNEHFKIQGLESFPNSQLHIYNRWGTLIYESTNYSNLTPWDATDAEDGVYFWIFNRSDGVDREGYVHVMHKKP
jgi:hypothetical protein